LCAPVVCECEVGEELIIGSDVLEVFCDFPEGGGAAGAGGEGDGVGYVVGCHNFSGSKVRKSVDEAG